MVRESAIQTVKSIKDATNAQFDDANFASLVSDNEMNSDPDGVITVTGGAPSFDDFMEMESARNEAAKIKEEKISGKKNEKKETIAEKDRQALDEDPKPGDAEKETPVEEEKSDTKVKGFKAKRGEEEFELTGDETIQMKVAGNIEEVSLNDLKNNYAGKVGWDKKFTELDKKHKLDLQKIKEERDSLYQPLRKFEELVSKGQAGDALLHLVDFVGQDSYAFRKNLIDALTPVVRERLEMSPEQLEAHEYKLEVEHLRQKEKSALERSKREQSNKELAQRTAKVQETYSISEEDFREHANVYKEYLHKEGKLTKENFTPEAVGRFYQATKNSEKLYRVIDQIDKGLYSDQKMISDAMELLFEAPQLSDDELKNLILEYKGVNQKLIDATKKAGIEGKVSTPPMPSNRKVDFFEDFDE